jgi:uncharacterized protein YbjT (DUF2867 family)
VATNDRTVTVFGGTGFLGRRIVRNLRSRGFPVRIASRHPDRGHRLFCPDDPQLQSVGADIGDERSVADALAGAYGVVNAVYPALEAAGELQPNRLKDSVGGAGQDTASDLLPLPPRSS